MANFEMQDSGQRRQFESGAVRDVDTNKPRPDLISPHALMRAGEWMAWGAKKYGDRNWEKGMPVSVFLASLERHLLKWKMGETDEDHMAAVLFNVQAILHFEELAYKTGDPQLVDLLDTGASAKVADEICATTGYPPNDDIPF